jgi:YgiT-type zinc finger domain-containing protein
VGGGFKNKEAIIMMTKCYFCGGKVKEEEVNIDFWWGERLIIFKEVPAEVCQQCGEKFFDAKIYKEMERMSQAEAKPSKSITVNVIEFKEALKV